MKSVVTKITMATLLTMSALPVFADEGDALAIVKIVGSEAVKAGQVLTSAQKELLPEQNALLITGEKIQCLLKLDKKGEAVAAGSFCNIGLNVAGVTSLDIE